MIKYLNSLKRVLVILSCILLLIGLAGCNSTPSRLTESQLSSYFADNQFANHNKYYIESAKDIFTLDDDIKKTIRRKISSTHSHEERVKRLMTEIIGKPNKDYIYSGAADLTASEAYRYKTANCLSLTIMAYSMAKEANIGAAFQEVFVPEFWTDRQGQKLANGHVNLRLFATQHNHIYHHSIYTKEVDFAPEVNSQSLNKRTISKAHIQALFYNNRAANALIEGDLDYAYHYLKQAIELHPDDSPTWSNLGLLYKRRQLIALAEKAYNKALELDPNNLTPLDNLAVLYKQQGKLALSKSIQDKLKTKRANNPFYHQYQGDLALESGDYLAAVSHYKRAIRIAPKHDSFYFGLARAYYSLGDNNKTQQYLAKAKRYADFDDDSHRYQAKLNMLGN
ncbi:hypothetical protein C2869_01405 [Saccharobesus litoralis]|uniref:Uncharacterized protein n=1 Tax=Saccharobesus litoralis TaxID=2172099 RepID=A0A2S0VLX6_9ALTE|nr:tetratricopeptide repeat protein [Saccharobesus litoralis]AWB65182.1 hypothetical protein C2869_01405 [Saccharobesus litoralis]